MKLLAIPVTQREAFAYIERHHRHHDAPRGFKFAIGAITEAAMADLRTGALTTLLDHLCGVVVVGRPVARERQDGVTAEITRLCTDGTRNACSFLYGRAVKASLAMGYRRVGTYLLASESGASVRAANFRLVADVRGRSWDAPSRRRVDHHPTVDKHLYEVIA